MRSWRLVPPLLVLCSCTLASEAMIDEIEAYEAVFDQSVLQRSTSIQSLVIPEPLVFDLVRDLGAKKGELEVNALFVVPLDGSDPTETEVAPEIEYVVWDDLAVELELPFSEGGLDSVKLAAQWTFGRNEPFIHGMQIIAERFVDLSAWELSLLYVPAYRFNETWSVLGLLGLGADVGGDVDDDWGWLLNGTVFADIGEQLTFGFEVNAIVLSGDEWSVRLMPQFHYAFNEHFVIQAGIGVFYLDGEGSVPGDPSAMLVPAGEGWFPQAAFRVIYNF